MLLSNTGGIPGSRQLNKGMRNFLGGFFRVTELRDDPSNHFNHKPARDAELDVSHDKKLICLYSEIVNMSPSCRAENVPLFWKKRPLSLSLQHEGELNAAALNTSNVIKRRRIFSRRSSYDDPESVSSVLF